MTGRLPPDQEPPISGLPLSQDVLPRQPAPAVLLPTIPSRRVTSHTAAGDGSGRRTPDSDGFGYSGFEEDVPEPVMPPQQAAELRRRSSQLLAAVGELEPYEHRARVDESSEAQRGGSAVDEPLVVTLSASQRARRTVSGLLHAAAVATESFITHRLTSTSDGGAGHEPDEPPAAAEEVEAVFGGAALGAGSSRGTAVLTRRAVEESAASLVASMSSADSFSCPPIISFEGPSESGSTGGAGDKRRTLQPSNLSQASNSVFAEVRQQQQQQLSSPSGVGKDSSSAAVPAFKANPFAGSKGGGLDGLNLGLPASPFASSSRSGLTEAHHQQPPGLQQRTVFRGVSIHEITPAAEDSSADGGTAAAASTSGAHQPHSRTWAGGRHEQQQQQQQLSEEERQAARRQWQARRALRGLAGLAGSRLAGLAGSQGGDADTDSAALPPPPSYAESVGDASGPGAASKASSSDADDEGGWSEADRSFHPSQTQQQAVRASANLPPTGALSGRGRPSERDVLVSGGGGGATAAQTAPAHLPGAESPGLVRRSASGRLAVSPSPAPGQAQLQMGVNPSETGPQQQQQQQQGAIDGFTLIGLPTYGYEDDRAPLMMMGRTAGVQSAAGQVSRCG